MNCKQLSRLLAANGQSFQPGYNYVVFSVGLPEPEVARTVALLRRKRSHMEREYRKATGEPLGLTPYVALPRKRSVLVPTTFGTRLNVLSRMVRDLPGMHEDAKVPVWC
jgi:hypothetical protein